MLLYVHPRLAQESITPEKLVRPEVVGPQKMVRQLEDPSGLLAWARAGLKRAAEIPCEIPCMGYRVGFRRPSTTCATGSREGAT